jgi:4-hydroxythreonine-4-phosphate dehydrogenase
MSLPLLALTTGEPAGIGPDLALLLAASAEAPPARWVALGDPALLAERAEQLGLNVSLRLLDGGELGGGEEVPAPRCGELCVWPVPLKAAVTPGRLDSANAGYVLALLDRGIAACQTGEAQALVTAPLHKGAIIDGGHPGFTGHTEYLRDACGADEVVMMLATRATASPLRVALATTHLPLARVAEAITAQGIERVLRLLAADLERHFGIAMPRIAVCGLNPHAGESGHLGREELDVIIPALTRLRQEGLQLEGPLPADTLFTPGRLDAVDAVLAMYHDQGLPVLKYAGFGRAANITLGLPIVRTSVDHGTALDLAATGRVDIGSLREAVAVAAEMARAGALS